MQNASLINAGVLLGRVLLAAIFILSGFNKIGAYAATAAHMTNAGVPGSLLPLVIILELVAGALVVAGWQTRVAALALAGFTALATYFFHFDFGNEQQVIHFLKNLSIIGGLLVLAGSGPGAWSVEGRKSV
jgi:putative oxidoreductase